MAPSSSGPGCHLLKVKIRGSNPLGATQGIAGRSSGPGCYLLKVNIRGSNPLSATNIVVFICTKPCKIEVNYETHITAWICSSSCSLVFFALLCKTSTPNPFRQYHRTL